MDTIMCLACAHGIVGLYVLRLARTYITLELGGTKLGMGPPVIREGRALPN